VVRDFADVKYGSGYGVIIKQRKRDIERALRGADWLTHSSKATNHCRHIRMQHIRDALIAAGYRDDRRPHDFNLTPMPKDANADFKLTRPPSKLRPIAEFGDGNT